MNINRFLLITLMISFVSCSPSTLIVNPSYESTVVTGKEVAILELQDTVYTNNEVNVLNVISGSRPSQYLQRFILDSMTSICKNMSPNNDFRFIKLDSIKSVRRQVIPMTRLGLSYQFYASLPKTGPISFKGQGCDYLIFIYGLSLGTNGTILYLTSGTKSVAKFFDGTPQNTLSFKFSANYIIIDVSNGEKVVEGYVDQLVTTKKRFEVAEADINLAFRDFLHNIFRQIPFNANVK